MSEHYQPRIHRAEPEGLSAVAYTPRDRLVAAHADAAEFFEGQLDASWGPRYLVNRGFTKATARHWQMGYAPSGHSALKDHLVRLGYSTEELLDAGLIKETSEGKVIDRFRDRVMIPIRDLDGSPVAFFGRAAPMAPNHVPKVLNSPNSELFRKGEVLFGLHQGLERLDVGAQPVLAEGPWDALAINFDPRYVGLATCGTSLTDAHVELLRRHVPIEELGVITAFDGDAAGLRASMTAWTKLAPITDFVYGVRLPAKADPAEVLQQHGPKQIVTLFNHPEPLADLVVDARLREIVDREDGYRPLDNWYGRYMALRQITDELFQILRDREADDIVRQVHRIARTLDMPVTEVTDVLADNCGQTETPRPSETPGPSGVTRVDKLRAMAERGLRSREGPQPQRRRSSTSAARDHEASYGR